MHLQNFCQGCQCLCMQHPACRLTYLGYDFLAIHALVKQGAISSVGRQIGVGKESDVFEVGTQHTLCVGRQAGTLQGRAGEEAGVFVGAHNRFCDSVLDSGNRTRRPSGQPMHQACSKDRQGSCAEGEPHLEGTSTCCIGTLLCESAEQVSCAKHSGGAKLGLAKRSAASSCVLGKQHQTHALELHALEGACLGRCMHCSCMPWKVHALEGACCLSAALCCSAAPVTAGSPA